jgi:hypothetical protein
MKNGNNDQSQDWHDKKDSCDNEIFDMEFNDIQKKVCMFPFYIPNVIFPSIFA